MSIRPVLFWFLVLFFSLVQFYFPLKFWTQNFVSDSLFESLSGLLTFFVLCYFFVFDVIFLCFKLSFCVLNYLFVFYVIFLCFMLSFCVLFYLFVFYFIFLFFMLSFCVLFNLFCVLCYLFVFNILFFVFYVITFCLVYSILLVLSFIVLWLANQVHSPCVGQNWKVVSVNFDSLIIATINSVSKKCLFSESWFADEKSFQWILIRWS